MKLNILNKLLLIHVQSFVKQKKYYLNKFLEKNYKILNYENFNLQKT